MIKAICAFVAGVSITSFAIIMSMFVGADNVLLASFGGLLSLFLYLILTMENCER